MPIDDRIRDGLRLNADQSALPVEQHLGEVLHRRRRRARVRASVAAGVLGVLVAVPWATHERIKGTSAPPVLGAPQETAEDGDLPTALHGTWMVRTTPSQVKADLQRSGFGRYAARFVEVERLGPGAVDLAVTFAADSFEVRWHRSDGTWNVEWYGRARETGGVLVLTDGDAQADDTYRWTVEDGRTLRLRFVSTTTPDLQGIPFEATFWAYFTRPLDAVECTPVDLDPCL